MRDIPAGSRHYRTDPASDCPASPDGIAARPISLNSASTRRRLRASTSSLSKALVSGEQCPQTAARRWEGRRVRDAARLSRPTKLGVIAYETKRNDGAPARVCKSPRTFFGDRPAGAATGAGSVRSAKCRHCVARKIPAAAPSPPATSPFGRHAVRGWMGRADRRTRFKGMFVNPPEVVEIGRRHPELGATAHSSRREREQARC